MLTPAERRQLVEAPLPMPRVVVHPKRIWGGCGIAHPEYARLTKPSWTAVHASPLDGLNDAAMFYGTGWE